MSWTDDRVELLKKLWGEGRTAAEIAGELGGVTRNAVIGKAHRLKLSGRASPIQQNKKPANSSVKPVKAAVKAMPKPAPVAEKKSVSFVAPVVTDEILESDKNRKRVSLMDLPQNGCRWPIGDPRDKDFGFCGCKKSDPSSAYCDEHAAVAYQQAGRVRALSAEDLEREEKARAERMALQS